MVLSNALLWSLAMPRKNPPALRVVAGPKLPEAPAHLGRDGNQLWQDIQRSYEITDPGGLALLQTACEAQDRIASCRRQISDQGELLMVRGLSRVHPLCAVERDARAVLVRPSGGIHSQIS
jgi:phage terminase small subunit